MCVILQILTRWTASVSQPLSSPLVLIKTQMLGKTNYVQNVIYFWGLFFFALNYTSLIATAEIFPLKKSIAKSN